MLQALLAAAGLVLFGTASSYYQNTDEFTFSFFQLLPYVLALTAIAAAVLYAIRWLVARWIPSARSWLIPFIATVLWAQGSFNVPDYGPLDGSAIRWSRFALQPLRDLAVIAVVGALFYAARRRLRDHPLLIVSVLALLQAGHAAAAAWQIDRTPRAEAPDEGIYRFSTERNVMLVVLDAFQSDIFLEILTRRPEYRRQLDGFTYYPDVVGLHPSTLPTIPGLFMGEHYRNTPSLPRFRRRIFSPRSIVSDFSRSGYQVDLIYRAGFPPSIPDWVDHAVPADRLGVSWRDALEEAVNAFEFTLFRSTPQVVRRALYVDGSWWLSAQVFRGYPASVQHRGDVTMLDHLERRSHTGPGRPVFKFVHFFTPHLPIVVDSDLQPVRRRFDRDAFRDQAEGSLRMLLRLLDTLRRINAYDTTRIVVVGDHGRSGTGIKPELLKLASASPLANPGIPGLHNVMPSAIPLFLVKPEGARGPLKIDPAPVSLVDVAPTLVDGISRRADRLSGYSVLSGTIPRDRRREFFYYRWMEHSWGTRYLDPITVFTVNGHSWLPESWSRSTTIRAGGREESAPQYVPGTMLAFRSGGNAGPFLVSGWGSPERRGRWTTGPVATMALTGSFEQGRDYQLRLTASPNLGRGRVKQQIVELVVNGVSAGEAVLNGAGARTLSLTIPAEAVQPDRLLIQLRVPNHVSPAKLGLGRDERSLGIYVSEMVVE